MNPVKIFQNNMMAARFWFFTSLFLSILCVLQPYLLMKLDKVQEKVIIMDEADVFHIVTVKGFEESSRLHAYMASLAVKAFLDRSPAGPDNPELLKQIYIEPSLSYAGQLIQGESTEFKLKNIHQKSEISGIDSLQADSEKVIAHVKGQVIRSGTYKEQSFSESLNFEISMTMLRNRNLSTNGRLPLAVWNLKYRIFKDGK